VVGSISLDVIKQPRIFSQNEVELCQSLASQVSTAIENAQLFDRVVTLMSVGQILTSGLKLDEVLKQIVNYATLALPNAERGAVHLYDGQTGILRLSVHTHYLGSAAIDALNLRSGEGIAGWVYEHQQTVVVSDAWTDARYKRIENPEVPIHKSMICVPLRIKDRVIGTLSLTNTQATGVFQDDDLRLLSTFADQAAIAIENARLLQEAQEGQAYLSSLYEASSQILSPQTPEQVLQAIVDSARISTGAYQVTVILFNETERPQILVQSGGESLMDVSKEVRQEGNSVFVIRSGQPLFIAHPADAYSPVPLNPIRVATGTQAAACLPMSLMGRNIGVLWVEFAEIHSFSEGERKALQLFANQSAIAYDNARRIQELGSLHDAVEKVAGQVEVQSILQQIVMSAKEVSRADYAFLWPYDEALDNFISEELVAVGIPSKWIDEFKKDVSPVNRIIRRLILDKGYLPLPMITPEIAEHIGPRFREFFGELQIGSFQGILLEVGEDKQGILCAGYKESRSFSEEDRQILETLAHHAALALKKARLFDQVKRAREAARAVAKLSAIGELKETLPSIVQSAQEALRCDAAVLYAFDEAKRRFTDVAGVGLYSQANLRSPKNVDPASSLWEVVALPEPFWLAAEQAPEADIFKGNFLQKEEIKSALVFLLRAAGQRVGALFISYRAPHQFTEDQLKDAALFADQAAVAIHNTQLHAETGKRAEALQGLYNAGMSITGKLSLDQTLSEIARQALHIVGASRQVEGCYSHVALRESNRLRFAAACPEELLTTLNRKFGEIDLSNETQIGITGQTIKTGQSRRIGDVSEDLDRFGPFVAEVHSALSVPLKVGDQVIGAIGVRHPERDIFTLEDQRNVELLAAQAAIAIENARRITELAQANEELKELDQRKSEFISTISHELRTPLGRVQSCVENLLGSVYGPIAEEQRSRLEMALSSVREEARLIRDLLDLVKIEGGRAKPDRRNESISKIICDVINVYEHYADPKKLLLITELPEGDSINAWIDVDMVKRVLTNLLDNALKFTPEGGMIIVTALSLNSEVEIRVKDTGNGIPEDQFQKIFDRFYQVDSSLSRKAGGVGIGLNIAKEYVEMHGGRIGVESIMDGGATFFFTLPKNRVEGD